MKLKKIFILLSILFIVVFLLFFVFFQVIPKSDTYSIGSYELFSENGISYYGTHDYSIFCSNDGFLQLSIYKIFDDKKKTVFETCSYDDFILKLEDMFQIDKIEKINLYGTCLLNSSYQSLGYALDNSQLIEYHEKENFDDKQLIHIKTVNEILIEIEFLWSDIICTCRGV